MEWISSPSLAWATYPTVVTRAGCWKTQRWSFPGEMTSVASDSTWWKVMLHFPRLQTQVARGWKPTNEARLTPSLKAGPTLHGIRLELVSTWDFTSDHILVYVRLFSTLYCFPSSLSPEIFWSINGKRILDAAFWESDRDVLELVSTDCKDGTRELDALVAGWQWEPSHWWKVEFLVYRLLWLCECWHFHLWWT